MAPPALSALRRLVGAIVGAVRTVVGAPDYEHYLAHMRTRHPEREPLTREAFTRERLEARYNRPGSRCC